MKHSVGIDVGLSGAIAFLNPDGSFHCVFDMPVMSNGKGKAKVKNQVNPAELVHMFMSTDILFKDMTVYVEQVSSMPGQGVAGVFSFGDSFGCIRGVLAALGVPMILIPPRIWKKEFNLLGTEKDVARTVAQQRFPDAPLDRKKDCGRADAILIAEWGRQRLTAPRDGEKGTGG